MTHTALIERLAKPIDMQDVRLAAGEGKLSNADVLRAANAVVSTRAEQAAQVIRDLEAKVAGELVAWRWRMPDWDADEWALTDDPSPHPRFLAHDGTDPRIIEPLYAPTRDAET
jgi:hypothetical protein